jgi:acetolactate synthase-1/2/3 large subunit
VGALEALAEGLGLPGYGAPLQAHEPPSMPEGALTPEEAAAAVGSLLPEGAVIVDEAITASAAFFSKMRGRPRTTGWT